MRREEKLLSLLKPHDNWWGDGRGERNAVARAALLEFCREPKKLGPARRYVPASMFHSSYIRGLLAVKVALTEGRYERACNDITTLMAQQPLSQRRVPDDLARVLRQALEGSA